MKINLFIFAVPAFILLIGIEYFLSLRRKESTYQLADFANNVSSGILEQVSCLPLAALLIFNYNYLYHQYSLFHINTASPFTWLLLWLGVDFLYYWFHRASHRVNLLWIGHAVHHQSKQYNLSVALRQGIGQTLFSWIIYLPLAMLGFPTWMFLIIYYLNTVYQFWIHTKLIKHLGWFELAFNTPSHHRVHHGINPQYLDKNYGGSLIIWDKLFGTYEKEDEPADYGTTEPLDSWNPFYANIKVIADNLRYGSYLNSWRDRLLVFFMPPEWIIKKIGPEKFQTLPKSHPITDSKHVYPTAYILINILIAILGYCYLLIKFSPNYSPAWALTLFVLLTLYMLGIVLNHGGV